MLKSEIKNPFPASVSRYVEETNSTMVLAREMAMEKPATGSLVLASFQRAGRGRTEGRKWIGEKGQSLMVTILFKKEDLPFEISLFPLFAGYVLSDYLENELGIHSLVKWPNDVLVDGAKISGILCESYDDYVACGVGLNVNQQNFPENLRRKSCSIFTEKGHIYQMENILEGLLKYFYQLIKSYDWIEKLEKKLYRFGEKVTIMNGLADQGTPVVAFILGIGGYGQLILKDLDGKKLEIYAGEINF